MIILNFKKPMAVESIGFFGGLPLQHPYLSKMSSVHSVISNTGNSFENGSCAIGKTGVKCG